MPRPRRRRDSLPARHARDHGRSPATAVAIVTRVGDASCSRSPSMSGPAGAGDLVVAATATVHVGIRGRRSRGRCSGRWSASAADPAGPLGLAGRPGRRRCPTPRVDRPAIAGIDRAGRDPDRVASSRRRCPASGSRCSRRRGTGAEASCSAGAAGGRTWASSACSAAARWLALPLARPRRRSVGAARHGARRQRCRPDARRETRDAVRALLAPLGTRGWRTSSSRSTRRRRSTEIGGALASARSRSSPPARPACSRGRLAATGALARRRSAPRAYMCAISCSTRSSAERNGSLHSTVRCAWSFSLRCTQSTV